ncbi:MAG: type II toxin-antitoxin system VapC family toxin [Gilliamella sp.]|uniref:type II toxin-antitoxin system VapC family toxin n=1 Tax=Gilliamella sp. TaxID=1891236 RepID=UPI00263142F1|nr:type II toxin-antitoxin system VapC family toxin [Gilliamella sp.]MCO6553294.1 type II toxin-antitoxin system VapC family toxin [Gilliamella sp.]
MRYMLDTNAVTCFIKNNQIFIQNLTSVRMSQVCISSVTLGELNFGLAKRSNLRLEAIIKGFINNIDVLPWDVNVANDYGKLRANMMSQGKVLAPLDMMIAAHAFAINATLITNDKAFSQVPNLRLDDWSK